MVSGLVSLQDPVSGNEDNLHGVILHLKLCRSQNAHTWLILVSPPVQCTSSKIFMPNPKIRSMTLSEGTSMGEPHAAPSSLPLLSYRPDTMVIVDDSVGNVGSQSQNFGINLATLD